MMSVFAATGIHPFNPNAIEPQAYISAPILSQSVGTQNGDQSSTGTAQIIENTSGSVPNIENTSQTAQVLKNITDSVPVMEYSQTMILDPL